jgi:hypothetical protein
VAGEAVGWEPFGFGVGIEEGAIHALRFGTQDAVETDGVSVIVHDG